MKRVFVLWLIFLAMAQGREYKAVFDCSSDDARYISGRMKLVEETLRLIEKQGNTGTFALTLHGGCVPIVAANMDEIVSDEELPLIRQAQETLKRLHGEKKVEIVACAMSLKANGLDAGDVLPFVRVSEDSFIDTIGYQNDGYAVMTFP